MTQTRTHVPRSGGRWAIVACVAFLAFQAEGQAGLRKRVVVGGLEPPHHGTGAMASATLIDRLGEELEGNRKLRLVPIETAERTLRDARTEVTPEIEPETAILVGELLNAEILVTGTVRAEVDSRPVPGSKERYGLPRLEYEARVVVEVALWSLVGGRSLLVETVEGIGVSREVGVGARKRARVDDQDSGHEFKAVLAASIAAADRIARLVRKVESSVPWQGKVVRVESDGTVYIAPGSNAGLRRGTRLMVYSRKLRLTDPDSRIDLGAVLRGIIKVQHLLGDGRACTATVTEGTDVREGDAVREN